MHHKHGVHSASAKAEVALGLVQIGPHHSAHSMHEQHGVNVARNAKEVNLSIIVDCYEPLPL